MYTVHTHKQTPKLHIYFVWINEYTLLDCTDSTLLSRWYKTLTVSVVAVAADEEAAVVVVGTVCDWACCIVSVLLVVEVEAFADPPPLATAPPPAALAAELIAVEEAEVVDTVLPSAWAVLEVTCPCHMQKVIKHEMVILLRIVSSLNLEQQHYQQARRKIFTNA